MDLPEHSGVCFNWIFLILRQRKGAPSAMAGGTLYREKPDAAGHVQ